jgi:FKBP-type peptidyl-prolyl cis-trans isomerase SlyD
MLIEKDCVVCIQFKLTDADGNVLDQSSEGNPLAYIHGGEGILPGLENELTGKSKGDSFDVTVAPEEGFGEHQPHLVQQVPIGQFGDNKVEEGMQFTAQTDQGPMAVTITGVTEELVTVDANHPLAGLTLRFEGVVEEVRLATAEELDHGHVH